MNSHYRRGRSGSSVADSGPRPFDLHVRGEVPTAFDGSLVVSTSRRAKDRSVFRRWHDSSTDLLRLDFFPGRPGRITAHVLEVDPWAPELTLDLGLIPEAGYRQGFRAPLPYPTQPNHGLNVANDLLWATNLLFGSPLEVELSTWKPRRILQVVQPDEEAPGVSTTSHFAWSPDRRHTYFHQSLLKPQPKPRPVVASDLRLIELDVANGDQRSWQIIPPPGDAAMESANFHSGFCFEARGKRYVGLLRTGAIIPSLTVHAGTTDHAVPRMPASTIWLVEIDQASANLQAQLLPGVEQVDGLALSHLDVDISRRDGFILYANFKESPVGEETHGRNIYGEEPSLVAEHYPGMILEPLNYGAVIRYEWRNGDWSMRTFKRPYQPGRTSLGHTWLPINLQLEPGNQRLFATFSGFRPRLVSQHVAAAYPERSVEPTAVTFVPSLLMRFDARTLEPDYDPNGGHLSYAEPVAMAVAGDRTETFVCTFSPEAGLHIYRADDLNHVVCQAESPMLMHWGDDYFRPEPAHAEFVPR